MRIRATRSLMAGLLAIGTIGLLRSPLLLAFPVSQTQPNVSHDDGTYQGSWIGTFRTVGSQGQMLVFIDLSGNLYGSLESNDGENFAQISGHHRNNTFHIIFTPPPGSLNQFGTSESYTVDATATWEPEMHQFVISAPTRTGHSQLYTFERPSNP